MKSSSPANSTSDSAASLPLSQASNGAGVISVASYASIALAKLSNVTGSSSSGKESWNHSTYCGMEFRVAMTLSGVFAISTPAWTGPLACAARSGARPSQNCASLNTEFRTVGELRGPFCQPCPMDVGMLSSPPVARLWHELHEKTPDADMRGSKNSALPRSIFSGVIGLLLTAGVVDGSGENRSSAISRSSLDADAPFAIAIAETARTAE